MMLAANGRKDSHVVQSKHWEPRERGLISISAKDKHDHVQIKFSKGNVILEVLIFWIPGLENKAYFQRHGVLAAATEINQDIGV